MDTRRLRPTAATTLTLLAIAGCGPTPTTPVTQGPLTEDWEFTVDATVYGERLSGEVLFDVDEQIDDTDSPPAIVLSRTTPEGDAAVGDVSAERFAATVLVDLRSGGGPDVSMHSDAETNLRGEVCGFTPGTEFTVVFTLEPSTPVTASGPYQAVEGDASVDITLDVSAGGARNGLRWTESGEVSAHVADVTGYQLAWDAPRKFTHADGLGAFAEHVSGAITLFSAPQTIDQEGCAFVRGEIDLHAALRADAPGEIRMSSSFTLLMVIET